jgi:hypothetical protein
MTWPPLSWIFFGPRATFHTWHVWCYSKKPRSLIKAKVEVSLFFWKHSLRGVVRMTYLHHFKSEFKFQSWLMGVDKFLIDHPEVWASKVVSWERKKFGSRIGRVREQYLFWPGSKFFSLSTYHFRCSHLWMIDEKLIDTHKISFETWILTWNGEDKSIWPHLDARVFKKRWNFDLGPDQTSRFLWVTMYMPSIEWRPWSKESST